MTTSNRALTPGRLEALALLIALVGVALLVWPTRVVIPPYDRPLPSAPSLSLANARASLTADSIVAANLFSGSRRAPRERFTLPGTEVVVDPASTVPVDGAEAMIDTGPQLFGIVSIDGAPRALVQVARDSAPRLVTVGERIGRWRVQQIDADRAVLSSSSGTRVVRLSRRPPSDSGGLLP